VILDRTDRRKLDKLENFADNRAAEIARSSLDAVDRDSRGDLSDLTPRATLNVHLKN
jgi:hypothetical protein